MTHPSRYALLEGNGLWFYLSCVCCLEHLGCNPCLDGHACARAFKIHFPVPAASHPLCRSSIELMLLPNQWRGQRHNGGRSAWPEVQTILVLIQLWTVRDSHNPAYNGRHGGISF